MGLREAFRSFFLLHDRAKSGELKDRELAAYQDELGELLHALLATQEAALEPGQKTRRAFRVSQPVQVDICFEDRRVSTQTLNLSTGGFAATVVVPPEIGHVVEAILSVPRSTEEPLRLRARIANVRPREGGARVGFQFLEMDDKDSERLESLVLDTVLHHLAR